MNWNRPSRGWILLGLILAGALAHAAPVVVDDRMPAGNVVVEEIAGDTVRVRPDLRDTEGDWFYWAFRVAGAAGRTLTFRFGGAYGGHVVGVRGPMVSTDRGRTWAYAAPGSFTSSSFTYTFAPDAGEVWFSECHPYHPADWEAFLARHAAARGVAFETGVLCTTRRGRPVEKARFGCLAGTPKHTVLLTSRHHASETVATFALEGFLEAVLAEDDLGAWLRGNVEVLAVPFMDKDGVVDGDQGKNRRPHDHNRDYTAFVHPETKAMVAWIRERTDNRLDVWLDLHCPWIRGELQRVRLFAAQARRQRAQRGRRAAVRRAPGEGAGGGAPLQGVRRPPLREGVEHGRQLREGLDVDLLGAEQAAEPAPRPYVRDSVRDGERRRRHAGRLPGVRARPRAGAAGFSGGEVR